MSDKLNVMIPILLYYKFQNPCEKSIIIQKTKTRLSIKHFFCDTIEHNCQRIKRNRNKKENLQD